MTPDDSIEYIWACIVNAYNTAYTASFKSQTQQQ